LEATVFLVALYVKFISHKQLEEPNFLVKNRSDAVISPVVLSRFEIKHGVKRIAENLTNWCGFKQPLYIVTLLQASRPFVKDLISELENNNAKIKLLVLKISSNDINNYTKIDSTTVGTPNYASSYGFGSLKEVKNQRVLIVDDLIDSGNTMVLAKKIVSSYLPAEIKTAVLINKYDSIDIADHVAFDFGIKKEALNKNTIQDLWFFGYGMDHHELYRDLQHIGWIIKRPTDKASVSTPTIEQFANILFHKSLAFGHFIRKSITPLHQGK
jgi:hypoxanthine phosphoribosyltransferase